MKIEPSDTERAWRREIEVELLTMPAAEASVLIQLMRESRAAWALLLPPARGARRVLFLGDARSGTPAGLARLGWRVTVQDPATREFAERRGRATGAPLMPWDAPAIEEVESEAGNNPADGGSAKGNNPTGSHEPTDNSNNPFSSSASDSSASDSSASDSSASDSSATDISATDISATDISATDISATDISATDISATDISATDISAPGISAPDSSATDSSATDSSATDSSATDSSATGISATGISATGICATDSSAPTTGERPPESLEPAGPRPSNPLDWSEPKSVAAESATTSAFDLVWIEDDAAPTPISLAMAAGLSADLIAFTADNPLAYKRSSGFRADFRITKPLEFLRALLFKGYKRLPARLARLRTLSGQPARAVALYPDRRDFAHVVDWQRGQPDLTIGPAERKNGLKMLGRKLGLFPVLTPSYGIWSSKRGRQDRLLERLLDQLAERLEARPQTAEHLVATRGNAALVLTADWVVRVPLGHRALAATRQNAAGLAQIAALEHAVPAPTPLFLGELEVEGVPVWAAVEARLPGFGAGQLTGRAAAMGRLAGELAHALASLPRTAARELTADDARALFGPRFDVVCERAGDPGTVAALRQLEAETIANATGLRVPRVTCHRDLRPKHVIADAEGTGALVGIVDWSCLQLEGPPLYDLFHFIAQERTAQAGWTARKVWVALQDRAALTPGEDQALRAYEAALDLPRAWYAVIARAYPVLFGAMAEEHWDFSRPLWIKRMFGIG